VRRLALVTCLLAGLLSVSAGAASATTHGKRVARACKPAKKKKVAARASSVARPTPIRVREAKRRAAVKRAARRRCVRRPARRRAVTPAAPAAGAPAAAPAAPAAPQALAPDDPALPTAAEPGSNPFAVQVRAGEFFLQLSKPEVRAGNVRVEFNNRTAEDPHDLHLFREDGTGASYAFGELQSGEVEARTLPLTAGTWRLLCALPEHAARGMSVKLRVVTGSGRLP
jgi:hypothetical protein